MRFHKRHGIFLSVLFLLLFVSLSWAGSEPARGNNNSVKLLTNPYTIHLSGIILDAHHEPVDEAEIDVMVNGTLADKFETAKNGKFISRVFIDKAEIPDSTIIIKAHKASFLEKTLKVETKDLASSGKNLYLSEDLTLQRTLGPAFWIATGVFILAYVLISFEFLHRTLAAMTGAAIMLIISYTAGTINPAYKILSYEAAIKSIDMNVIFLLMGMMIIIGVLKETGFFQWCAYQSYRLAKGNVFLLCVYLMTFTAITSGFLDNVTTMLLLTGVTIEICVALSLNPLYMLMPLILSSNIGGTATLIGDPPNILIGSFAHLSFLHFVEALGPICLIVFVALVIYTKFVWGKHFNEIQIGNVADFTQQLKEECKITDRKLLTIGLIILAFVIFLFLTENFWHMEVCIAALAGAAILFSYAVVTEKVDLIRLIEKDIEWPTLLFFIFLFMLVGAVDSTGLLALVANWILHLSHGNFMAALTFILWISAIMSAFVDNIPFTATMLPIVAYLSQVIPGSANTLWWALALGACLGGNGTLIGASANVVTIGIADSKGYKTTFGAFMKTAFPFMLISIFLCQLWLMFVRPL